MLIGQGQRRTLGETETVAIESDCPPNIRHTQTDMRVLEVAMLAIDRVHSRYFTFDGLVLVWLDTFDIGI
ncbi:hypothetical protein [Gordonia terrae]